jgi:hypothetical protein
MSIELPVLRLGLVGFSADAQQRLGSVVTKTAFSGMGWELSRFSDADAWWVYGARTQLLGDGTLRIGSGLPGGRSVQLNLAEVDRPIAYSVPLAPRDFDPTLRFDPDSQPSIQDVLHKFEVWLQPLVAQFCLASQLIEHETALGSGVYHVISAGRLLAVVDLQGEVGVLPTAGLTDFERAMWTARPAAAAEIPEHFVRTSLSQLMWQYAMRTSRDVLPKRYRSGLLYFRRPPRLPQRMLKDSHLLIVRELVAAPASMDDLQQRTGLPAEQLAHDLAALYLVGSITSNPKRAAMGRLPQRRDAPDSVHSLPSGLNAAAVAGLGRAPSRLPDLTAPAPMSLE